MSFFYCVSFWCFTRKFYVNIIFFLSFFFLWNLFSLLITFGERDRGEKNVSNDFCSSSLLRSPLPLSSSSVCIEISDKTNFFSSSSSRVPFSFHLIVCYLNFSLKWAVIYYHAKVEIFASCGSSFPSKTYISFEKLKKNFSISYIPRKITTAKYSFTRSVVYT